MSEATYRTAHPAEVPLFEQHPSLEQHEVGLDFVCAELQAATYEAGLDFGPDHNMMIRALVSALATKNFLIFTGLSGSGKTRLASALGQWFGRDRYLLQPVRPDWTSPEAVLGSPFTDNTADGKYAWFVPRVLELVLAAATDPENPYLLVLEEMNLAHVEQYFADVLSGMEGDHPVVPNLTYEGGVWRQGQPEMPYIPWPKNLFLIGTINVDETTYRFSPKVLDRATTIEFRIDPGSLRARDSRIERLSRGSEIARTTFMKRALGPNPQWSQTESFANALKQLHRVLFAFDAEFGHRVFQDCIRLATMMVDSGCTDPREILDECLLNRMLPKFEHADDNFADVLQALATFCTYGSMKPNPNAEQQAPVLPRSLYKIQRLLRTQSRRNK